MSGRALRLAALAGLVGGVLAGLIAFLSALAAAEARFATYAAILVTLIAVQLGARAAATGPGDDRFGARIAAAATIAVLAGVLYGLALYLLYATLEPDLLVRRYAQFEARLWAARLPPERLAAGLAALVARRAQYLDPRYQAVEGAGTLLFCGLVLGAYLAFRARLASRMRRRAA